MKIKSVSLKDFRRFQDLTISDLPPARLVIIAGPNGSGKSSLFDAFSVWHQGTSKRLNWDDDYYGRGSNRTRPVPTIHNLLNGWRERVRIEFYEPHTDKKTFYLRSAYRNEPEFALTTLNGMPDPKDSVRLRRMIEQDGAVSENYQRLAANAFQDAFERHDENTTLKDFRQATIGEIRSSVNRLFPDLELNTLGNPLVDGTFRFTKGAIKGFSYKNLSGGEKAAFDLLLDMVVKRKTYNDTVFVIDEPESHMNTRLQGALLGELFDLIPDGSQLWVATHSIGMMRKARELYEENPSDVIFLDFEGHDFDETVELKSVPPTRAFWERILKVALADLAELVAPRELVICEGNPKTPVMGKNEEHDARCYEAIFSTQFPDTKFISGGGSKDVANDRLKFATVFPHIIPGLKVTRLIDRDDHAPSDISDFRLKDIRVLRRRHLEAYLYDDEVLRALYEKEGRLTDFAAMQAERNKYLEDSSQRGNPHDDVKSAASYIYNFAKQHLKLTGCGNDQMAFARNVLAPLIKPEMAVYKELKEDIFG